MRETDERASSLAGALAAVCRKMGRLTYHSYKR